MAEPRHWPAIEVRSARADEAGALADLVAAVLHDHQPLAVHDLIPPIVPPGGLWEPPEAASTAPPTPLAWRVCFADETTRSAAAAAIAALDPGLAVQSIELPDDDWVVRSQQSLTAIAAGDFIVAPPWDIPAPPPSGTHVIVIEPSMGFGTGHHQTTRLCLAALRDVTIEGRTVLDVGTGSGVLAIAASMLGACRVRAVDVDADAVAAARRSAALNVLPTPIVFDSADLSAASSEPAEVVLANLTGALLIRAAASLTTLVAANGRLVVSGFMEPERPHVEAALEAFDIVSRSHEDEWCAAVLRRR